MKDDFSKNWGRNRAHCRKCFDLVFTDEIILGHCGNCSINILLKYLPGILVALGFIIFVIWKAFQ